MRSSQYSIILRNSSSFTINRFLQNIHFAILQFSPRCSALCLRYGTLSTFDYYPLGSLYVYLSIPCFSKWLSILRVELSLRETQTTLPAASQILQRAEAPLPDPSATKYRQTQDRLRPDCTAGSFPLFLNDTFFSLDGYFIVEGIGVGYS